MSAAELTPQEEIALLIAARYPILWIVSHEERLVERAVALVAANAGFQPFYWDLAGGQDGNGEHQYAWRVRALDQMIGEPLVEPKKDPAGSVLRRIARRPDVAGWQAAAATSLGATTDAARYGLTEDQALEFNRDPDACRINGREIWILRDLAPALKADRIRRMLKNLAAAIGDCLDHDRLATIVLLGESDDVPADLKSSVRLYRWPLPSRKDRQRLVAEFLQLARRQNSQGDPIPIEIQGERQDVVDAAAGLTVADAGAALNESVARHGQLVPSFVADQKKLSVDGVPGLTWLDPDPLGLEAIGGLDLLRAWVDEQREPFLARSRPDSAAARYGLKPPKGIALVGEPGNGKSLTSAVVPAVWGVPLIQLDLGALKGSLMGQSESNMRRALEVIAGAAPVVVQLDEAEKELAGSGSRGDSGVGAHQLKALLTTLSEGTAAVFFILTINDVAQVLNSYPELFRAGRMDAIFRLGRPDFRERAAIVAVHLRRAKRDPRDFDLDTVARHTDTFSGAEIAALVPAALLRAYRDRPTDQEPREPTTDDLVVCANLTTPQAKIVEISPGLQHFYDTAARPASTPASTPTPDLSDQGAVSTGRDLRVPITFQGEN